MFHSILILVQNLSFAIPPLKNNLDIYISIMYIKHGIKAKENLLCADFRYEGIAY